jgi:hypothetical protein
VKLDNITGSNQGTVISVGPQLYNALSQEAMVNSRIGCAEFVPESEHKDTLQTCICMSPSGVVKAPHIKFQINKIGFTRTLSWSLQMVCDQVNEESFNGQCTQVTRSYGEV